MNYSNNESHVKGQFTAFSICCLVFGFWFSLLNYKYNHFGYYDWDLALYNQAIWQLSQGSFYSHLWGMNFLANHAEYITFLLVPIYKIFSHPMTLVCFKVLSSVFGGYILYLIARKSFSFLTSIIFMLLYFLYPPNVFGLLYEFHFESLSLILIFLLLYFFQNEQFKSFIVVAILTALIKENMPPIIVMFGIYGLLIRSKYEEKIKWGVAPIVIGLTVFITAIFFITPYLRKDFPTNNQYLGLYSQLGTSPIEIAKTFIFNPIKILSMMFDSRNIFYLKELFAPLMFLPLLSPLIVLLSLPLFLQHLLSGAAQEHTIYFHYATTFSPFLFVAMIETLRTFQLRMKKHIITFVVCLLVAVGIINLSHYKNALIVRLRCYSDYESAQLWRLINQIPSDKGVMATLSFLAPLSNRPVVESFLDVPQDRHGLAPKKFELSDDITYALISYDDEWVRGQIQSDPENSLNRIRKFFDVGWKEKDRFKNTVLLERMNPK